MTHESCPTCQRLHAYLEVLCAEQRRTTKQIQKLEHRNDALLRELEDLLAQLGHGMEQTSAPLRGIRRCRNQRHSEQLKELAAHGVSAIEIAETSDGRYRVQIDGRDFELPEKLGYLLLLLAEPEEWDGHGLMRWKSKEQLSLGLEKKFQGRVKQHALTHLIHRLRKELEAHQVNPFLVQTRRGKVRLALRVEQPVLS